MLLAAYQCNAHSFDNRMLTGYDNMKTLAGLKEMLTEWLDICQNINLMLTGNSVDLDLMIKTETQLNGKQL